MLAYAVMLENLARIVDEFEIVHAHIDWIHIPFLRRLGVPFVTTLHGRLDVPNIDTCFSRCFAESAFISISDAQRGPLPEARWVGTVYHGLPENLFVPNFTPKGYLAFLGRISPEKGPEAAIRIAKATGLPLKIAAKVDKVDQAYLRRRCRR